jgi:hypothetical protein
MPVSLIMMQAEKPALDAGALLAEPPEAAVAAVPVAAVLLEELAHALTARAAVSARPAAAAGRRYLGRGEADGADV